MRLVVDEDMVDDALEDELVPEEATEVVDNPESGVSLPKDGFGDRDGGG